MLKVLNAPSAWKNIKILTKPFNFHVTSATFSMKNAFKTGLNKIIVALYAKSQLPKKILKINKNNSIKIEEVYLLNDGTP